MKFMNFFKKKFMLSEPGFFLGPPGGPGGATTGCLPTTGPPPPVPKWPKWLAHGKFLDRFETNTEEKREKCLPSAGPPGRGGLLGFRWQLPPLCAGYFALSQVGIPPPAVQEYGRSQHCA